MACYLLDTNFFIQNFIITYPPDVVPGFWNKVIELANEGSIRSIDKVFNELRRKEDELYGWISESLPDGFFLSAVQSDVLNNYAQVIKWVNSQTRYFDNVKHAYSQSENADPWLIATAMTNPEYFSIVTLEASAPESKTRIKIPDVCRAVGIKTFTTIELFRELKISI